MKREGLDGFFQTSLCQGIQPYTHQLTSMLSIELCQQDRTVVYMIISLITYLSLVGSVSLDGAIHSCTAISNLTVTNNTLSCQTQHLKSTANTTSVSPGLSGFSAIVIQRKVKARIGSCPRCNLLLPPSPTPGQEARP